MTALPQHIKEKFYNTILGRVPIADFEQWLYGDKELEACLNPNDYFDLLSLNYKKSNAEKELIELLLKHIHLGEFDTFKILELLYEAQDKTDRLPYILMEFNELYWKQYYFLQWVSLGIGPNMQVPGNKNTLAANWEDLTVEQQRQLLDSFSPQLEKSIANVIDCLEKKKIVLIGEKNRKGYYEYIDHRTPTEMQFSFWHNPNPKKWWQFWK